MLALKDTQAPVGSLQYGTLYPQLFALLSQGARMLIVFAHMSVPLALCNLICKCLQSKQGTYVSVQFYLATLKGHLMAHALRCLLRHHILVLDANMPFYLSTKVYACLNVAME